MTGLKRLLNISIYKAERWTSNGTPPRSMPTELPDGRQGVFLDPHVIEIDDRDAEDELRFNAIGLVDGRMIFVTYTMRGAVVRIISARGAEPNEKRKYHGL